MSCDDGGGSKETSKKAVEFEVAELNPVVTPTDKPNLRHTAFHTHQDSLVAVADNLKETYSFKMRDILQTEELEIPNGVTVSVKSRVIVVTGPRGTLTKNVRHINMDVRLIKGKNKITLAVWQGNRKHVACLRTVKSLISNMVTGVTKGFLYKMRAVYAHFPINCIIQDDGHKLEIRNFLGEKTVRHVDMLGGVTISESKAQKDELIIEGTDIENVSQSAASIQGICRVRNKDIRKFLDGIYVSEKTTIAQD